MGCGGLVFEGAVDVEGLCDVESDEFLEAVESVADLPEGGVDGEFVVGDAEFGGEDVEGLFAFAGDFEGLAGVFECAFLDPERLLVADDGVVGEGDVEDEPSALSLECVLGGEFLDDAGLEVVAGLEG